MTIDSNQRRWRVRQGNTVWKKPKTMRAALELAKRALYGSWTPVTIEPVVVLPKRKRVAMDSTGAKNG